jgi:hypothetical protein
MPDFSVGGMVFPSEVKCDSQLSGTIQSVRDDFTAVAEFKASLPQLNPAPTYCISRKSLDSQIFHFQLGLDFFNGFETMILETHEHHIC